MAKRIIDENTLTAIGNSIRNKTGKSDLILTENMAAEIATIQTTPNLQDKTVTENGTYTPDEGYDGIGEIEVNVSGGGGLNRVLTNYSFLFAGRTLNTDKKAYAEEYLKLFSFYPIDIFRMFSTANSSSTTLTINGEVIFNHFANVDLKDLSTNQEVTQEAFKYATLKIDTSKNHVLKVKSSVPLSYLYNGTDMFREMRFWNLDDKTTGINVCTLRIELENIKFLNINYFLYKGNYGYPKLELTGLDISSATNVSSAFGTSVTNAPYLTKLLFDGSFGGDSTTATLTLDLSNIAPAYYTKDSFMETLRSLNENTNGNTRNIKVSTTIYNQLTDDDFAEAVILDYNITK